MEEEEEKGVGEGGGEGRKTRIEEKRVLSRGRRWKMGAVVDRGRAAFRRDDAEASVYDLIRFPLWLV